MSIIIIIIAILIKCNRSPPPSPLNAVSVYNSKNKKRLCNCKWKCYFRSMCVFFPQHQDSCFHRDHWLAIRGGHGPCPFSFIFLILLQVLVTLDCKPASCNMAVKTVSNLLTCNTCLRDLTNYNEHLMGGGGEEILSKKYKIAPQKLEKL